MILTLLLAAIFAFEPDTLAPAGITAQRSVSPPSQSVSGKTLTNATSAADAIRDFSGIQIRDYGGVGGLKTVNVRSLGSAHTAIFLDGVPIDNAQNAQVDLGRIFPEDLETIEFYAGQKSSLLQTAREYASASAIHMRSSIPSKVGIKLRFRGGAFATVSPTGSIETRRGRFAARLRLGGERASGEYPFTVHDFGKDTTMMRQNGTVVAFRGNAHMWYLPEGGRYEVSFRYYDSDRGIPGPVYKQAGKYPLSNDRQHDLNFTAQLSGEQTLTPSLKLLVKGRYSRDDLDYTNVSVQDPSVSATWNYQLHSAYLATSLGYQVTNWLNLNAAVDFLADKLYAQVNADRRQLFAALSGAFIFDPWRVQTSLLYQSSSDGYNFFCPSILADFHPREDWEFGALVKRSCRLPSFNDLYYTNVGGRNLKPEKVFQVSAWWMWQRAFGPWNFRVREELYYNNVQDKLICVPNGSLFRWSMYNIEKVKIFGDEWSVTSAYISKTWQAGITGRYTYQRAFNPADPWQIPYVPLHSGSFNLYGSVGPVRADIRGQITGTRYTASSSRPEAVIKPWTSWDLTLSWQIIPALKVALEVRNMFNAQYEIVKQYPMPGINVMGSITYEI